MTDWTDDMIETLKKARLDGFSFGQCTDIISREHKVCIGRNAAIGKASRLKLNAGNRSRAPSPKPKVSRPKPFASVNAVRRKKRLERSPREAGMPEPTPAPLIIAPTKFVDLDRWQCRWSVDPPLAQTGPDMACCGAPVIDRYAPEGRREATHCRFHFNAGVSR